MNNRSRLMTGRIRPWAALACMAIPIAATAGSCEGLVGLAIPASQIGLATHGARIASAAMETLPAGSTGASRAACIVKGAIAPVDPAAPDIKFQINLPANWNGRAVHQGGGGFDGIVADGRHFMYLAGVSNDSVDGFGDHLRHLPASDPVVAGYVTFGSDAGHQMDTSTPAAMTRMGSFATNAEALQNYAGDQLKKVHDVAVRVIERYYGHAARRMYFYGGSKGGQEALVVVQRWPSDYDGVIAIHPAYDLTALVMGMVSMAQRLYGPQGAWLSPQKTALIAQSVLKSCDALDGLTDGVVGNVSACRKAFDLHALACPSGGDTGPQCLSAAQIATAADIAGPLSFGFELSGVSQSSGFPLLEGAFATGGNFGTKARVDRPPTEADAPQWVLAEQFVRYVFMGDPTYDSLSFKPAEHVAALQRASHLLDANNADLDAFRRHGGKLLLLQGTVDMAVSPGNSIAYYERLRARYGAGLKDFVRFYMAPGLGHADGAFFVSWNSLTTLDHWADAGTPPGAQTVQDLIPDHGGRSRPLCEYPQWPKYLGTGNAAAAQSFACVSDGTD